MTGFIFDVYESASGARYLRESRRFSELHTSPIVRWDGATKAIKRLVAASAPLIELQFVDMASYKSRQQNPASSSFYDAMALAALALRKHPCIVTICGKFQAETVLYEAGRFHTLFPRMRVSFSKLFFSDDFYEIIRQLDALNVGSQVMLDCEKIDGKYLVKGDGNFLLAEDLLQRVQRMSNACRDFIFHVVSINMQGLRSPDEALLALLNRLAEQSDMKVVYSGGVQSQDHVIHLRERYSNIFQYFVGNAAVREILRNRF